MTIKPSPRRCVPMNLKETLTMNFLESEQAKYSSSNHEHEHPLHHVLNNLKTHLTNFVRIPNPFSSKLDNPLPTLKTTSSSDHSNESLTSVVDDECRKNLSLSNEEIKQLLNEVSVYRLSDPPDQRPVALTSDVENRDAIFYFFSESDAQALLSHAKSLEANKNIELTNVPLAEIIEAEEYCTRLVPELSQIKNAFKEREKAGFHCEKFSGVPVFRSDALKVMVDGTPNNIQPAFLRKEDLEKALVEEKQMDHTAMQSEIIQVMALEDIIQEMKDCSTSNWNNAVFIPPGNGKL